jgi:hypothetical protein
MTGDGAGKIGYDKEIKPLFREKDRDAMRRAFDLWSYTDVVAHSEAIAKQLSEGTMPCDGPWPTDHVELFQRWIEEGTAE